MAQFSIPALQVAVVRFCLELDALIENLPDGCQFNAVWGINCSSKTVSDYQKIVTAKATHRPTSLTLWMEASADRTFWLTQRATLTSPFGIIEFAVDDAGDAIRIVPHILGEPPHSTDKSANRLYSVATGRYTLDGCCKVLSKQRIKNLTISG